jgi:hypothetical protein
MIEQTQRRLPEWLPEVGEPLDGTTAALIFSSYADQIDEFCAKIQHTLHQHHRDVRVYHYTVTDIRANWKPKGRTFILAHVAVADWSHAKVVRFVQLRCEKTTGQIVLIDRDRLLK